MNQKQPSSETWMKPRKLLRPAALTLALVLALCSMLTLTRCSIRHPPRFWFGPSLAEMDRRAQPHFERAKQTIPAIAENLSSLPSLSKRRCSPRPLLQGLSGRGLKGRFAAIARLHRRDFASF